MSSEVIAATRPLLILPRPTFVQAAALPNYARRPPRPGVERQRERLSPRFDRLEQAFARERARLAVDALGADPELVLVLETVGSVSTFLQAVEKITGMEWLGAWNEDDIGQEGDVAADPDEPGDQVRGQILLIMTDQRALRELLSLWNHFLNDADGKWQYGRTKWRDLFYQLHAIRPWSAQDRVRNTGLLEEWQRLSSEDVATMPVEVEIWYRLQPEDRQRYEERLLSVAHAEGGVLIRRYVRTEIAYHALLLELPMSAVQRMLEQPETRLVACEGAMFYRPVGQVVGIIPPDAPHTALSPPSGRPLPQGAPVIALLDGLPLENHRWLASRLVIDDPDGWTTAYPARDRVHGTAMASLIVNGDLSANESPLRRPLYVRPIMQPDPRDFNTPKQEAIPTNVLPADLVHRAVSRMFDRQQTTEPVAPQVRVINLSVGDLSRPFDRIFSPWARMLDWLSWKYRVLFVVSAGNYTGQLSLGVPSTQFPQLSTVEVEDETLRSIAATASGRALLTPSEAVNALTVGALHQDASPPTNLGQRRDLLQSDGLPSPINRMGPGHNRAIKPEILQAGGRQTYTHLPGVASNATLRLAGVYAAPGQQVATPSAVPGSLADTIYTRGTSNAAALTSRAAAEIYEVLNALEQREGQRLPDRYFAVLIKALLVHSARWGQAASSLQRALNLQTLNRSDQTLLARILGFGSLDAQRVLSCTDRRVTLLGWGEFNQDDAHRYTLPLPPSLAGPKVNRRLTQTLAWFTPTRASHTQYRQVLLWLMPPDPQKFLRVKRQDAHWHAVRRGTIQHEVFEGDRATTYRDGEELSIVVNCRCPMGNPPGMVQYALAVTLEVSEDVEIKIYEEVRDRVEQRIREQVRSNVPVQVRPTHTTGS